MNETRMIRNPLTGNVQTADVVHVSYAENDDPMILHLSDGSVLRMKLDVAEVVRFPDTWDGEGHPLYSVKNGVSMIVLDSDPKLRRDGEHITGQ